MKTNAIDLWISRVCTQLSQEGNLFTTIEVVEDFSKPQRAKHVSCKAHVPLHSLRYIFAFRDTFYRIKGTYSAPLMRWKTGQMTEVFTPYAWLVVGRRRGRMSLSPGAGGEEVPGTARGRPTGSDRTSWGIRDRYADHLNLTAAWCSYVKRRCCLPALRKCNYEDQQFGCAREKRILVNSWRRRICSNQRSVL